MNAQETIVFGGGCFWCTEAVFKMIKGVASVTPGYAGGTKPNPTYEEVSRGDTGYAESARVVYQPAVTSFHDLLTVFFASHDPTSLNRQGDDVGPQYRSVVFYTTEAQKKEIEDFIMGLNTSHMSGGAVVTQVEPLTTFYEAEQYHKDYYAHHKNNSYCMLVINPKLEKVQKEFASLLKAIDTK